MISAYEESALRKLANTLAEKLQESLTESFSTTTLFLLLPLFQHGRFPESFDEKSLGTHLPEVFWPLSFMFLKSLKGTHFSSVTSV